jgi:hypothetical protein
MDENHFDPSQQDDKRIKHQFTHDRSIVGSSAHSSAAISFSNTLTSIPDDLSFGNPRWQGLLTAAISRFMFRY